jgi:pyruvate dehydrogenase E2 component (dihydrolipoamide acetyltransferase)
MPRLGVAMVDATVTKWLKQEGDKVQKGEPFFEIETEKTQMVIEAIDSGVLSKIVAPEGSVVPVAGLLALLSDVPGTETVDISASGEKKEIQEVEKNKPEAKAELVRVSEIREMTPQRKVIAQRLSQSHLTAVHVTIANSVDMSEMISSRNRLGQEFEKKIGTKPSYTDMIVQIVSRILKKYPLLNSSVEDDKIKVFADINVGVAVALEDSLIVPVVYNASEKSLAEISSFTKEEIDKARKGELKLDEVTGGTFTISNLGIYDVEVFTPIINPPQSALLGIGKILEKPWVVNGQIVIRPIATLSLSFDHRVIDGAVAARFLQEIKEKMENPQSILNQ